MLIEEAAMACGLLEGVALLSPGRAEPLVNDGLGVPLRLASPLECCSRCARTLGCTAFVFTRREEEASGTCRLQRWQPIEQRNEPSATSGRLRQPCTVDCLFPELSPGQVGPVFEKASLADIPWMNLYHEPHHDQFQVPPDSELLKINQSQLSPPPPLRIAVCIAGQARTLAHPTVYGALYERLLERGRHDLYAVLKLGTNGCGPSCTDRKIAPNTTLSGQRQDDQRLPTPCEQPSCYDSHLLSLRINPFLSLPLGNGAHSNLDSAPFLASRFR